MWNILPAESEIDYNATFRTVRTKFGDDVAAYIPDIDPICWTVFVNVQLEVIDKQYKL